MADVGSLLSNLAGLAEPTGLWAIILNWIEKTVVNYGWVIILFTLLVKVCMMPLDFVVKFSTKRTTLMQQKLAPQIQRINAKYANDPNGAKLQTNALYKREGMRPALSCIIMLLNFVVTLVVFFSLFASLREMSAFKAINQYAELQNAYQQEFNTHLSEVYADFKTKFDATAEQNGKVLIDVYTNEEGEEVVTVAHTEVTYLLFSGIFEQAEIRDDVVLSEHGLLYNFYTIGEKLTPYQQIVAKLYFRYDKEHPENNIQVGDLLVESAKLATTPAASAAAKKWDEVKDTWLWIGNIWVAESYKSPVPTYADLMSLARSAKKSGYVEYVEGIGQDVYSTVTSAVRVEKQNKRWNGYFILAVFAGVLSFLSQWISEKMSKPKNKQVSQFVDQANPQGGAMKFMKILLPALMIIFVVSSSAAFGLYIVVSSLISIVISSLIGLIVDACFKKKQEEIYAQLEKETMKALKKNKKRG